MERDRNQRLTHLDGLRGIAALIVVFYHYGRGFFPSINDGLYHPHNHHLWHINGTPFELLFAGNFAVCLFFVLSGFVLSAQYFNTGDHRVLITGASRRYLRLMLPVAGTVFLSWILLRLGLYFNHQTAPLTQSKIWLDSFWTFPPNWHHALYQTVYGTFFRYDNPQSYDTNLWTMPVELLGSLMLFGFLALAGRLPKRWALYVIGTIVLIKTYYLAFLLGIVICDVWHHYRLQAERLIRKWGGWLLVIGLIMGAWPNEGAWTWYSQFHLPGFTNFELGQITRIAGAALLISCALAYSPVIKLLKARVPRYLGKISFSLYLLHLLVIGSFSSYLFRELRFSHGYVLSFGITFALSLIIIFIASDLFTRYVDMPAISAAKGFSSWLTRPVVRPSLMAKLSAPPEIESEALVSS